MKKPICVVHIGAPKTGSTALQKYMAEQSGILRMKGLLYCESSLRGFGHHDVAFLLGGGYPEWATPQPKSLEELAAQIEDEVVGYDGSILLSSENFYLYPNPKGLQEFLVRTGISRGRIVKILTYVRPQDEAHESWYNQTIKAQGYTHLPEQCVERFYGLWDYAAQLAPWAETFGRQALVVRPYQACLPVYEAIVADVLGLFALDSSDLPQPENVRVNSRINRDIIEFQRMMNGLTGSFEQKRVFHKALMELTRRTVGSGLFDESYCITAAQRKALIEQYAASNAEVARTYLGREKLFEARDTSDVTEERDYQGLNVERFAAIIDWLSEARRSDPAPHSSVLQTCKSST